MKGDYTGISTASVAPQGHTLTIDDIKKAYKSIQKYDDRRKREAIKRTNAPGYWEAYETCINIIVELHKKKSWKRKKLHTALNMLYALDIGNPMPISVKGIEDYEKLKKEYEHLVVDKRTLLV